MYYLLFALILIIILIVVWYKRKIRVLPLYGYENKNMRPLIKSVFEKGKIGAFLYIKPLVYEDLIQVIKTGEDNILVSFPLEFGSELVENYIKYLKTNDIKYQMVDSQDIDSKINFGHVKHDFISVSCGTNINLTISILNYIFEELFNLGESYKVDFLLSYKEPKRS